MQTVGHFINILSLEHVQNIIKMIDMDKWFDY